MVVFVVEQIVVSSPYGHVHCVEFDVEMLYGVVVDGVGVEMWYVGCDGAVVVVVVDSSPPYQLSHHSHETIVAAN